MDDDVTEPAEQTAPDVMGCDAHPEVPDYDCLPCLEKWGYSYETPQRKSLMSLGMLKGRFLPGISGNPAGRGPGRKTFEATVEGLLDEEITHGSNLIEKREALARVLVDQALRSHPKRWAMELLVGRMWPEESKHDHTISGRVQVVFDEDDLEA